MQPFDQPDVISELEAIDATLRGEAVDPIYAELAELSLLVAADRPQLSDEAARRLDERLAAAAVPASPRRRLTWWPALSVGLPALAALVVAIVIVGHGGTGAVNGSAGSSASEPAKLPSALGRPRLDSLVNKQAVVRAAHSPAASAPGAFTPYAASAGQLSLSPAPAQNGRAVIQSAQLSLSAAGNRIDSVAQELFDVVGQERGIVKNSQVTAGGAGGGYANFTLSIPSSNLAVTMSRLSALRYAHVASRTDSTEDVNGQYLADGRRLQDARALRTSLLKQLAAATTSEQVVSLTAQIHDAEASISSDEATLRGLRHQIDFSSLNVTVNQAGPVPVAHPSSGSGGFTLGRAAHDALRVLTVAAGVILIVLAALIPVSLVVALWLWVAGALRHRRREQALDAA